MERNQRNLRKGTVISNKMKDTVVVEVYRVEPHARYGKVVKRRTKCYAHYDSSKQSLNIGDDVTIMETRPLSKLKRWRVVAA